jgi:hypothetical protein
MTGRFVSGTTAAPLQMFPDRICKEVIEWNAPLGSRLLGLVKECIRYFESRFHEFG